MRIVGLDLNGIFDYGARDWDLDGEVLHAEQGPIVVEGGVGSVVVLQGQEKEVWIGGPQASLAPHGRGPGWGRLGDVRRRVAVSALLDGVLFGRGPVNRDAFCAALQALTRLADGLMLTIPDIAVVDEGSRTRLLEVLSNLRMRTANLLWHPVALFLEAQRINWITPDDAGSSFLVLSHTVRGLEVQSLRLRADKDHPGHFAPERQDYGHIFGSDLGIGKLEQRISDAVIAANPSLNGQGCEEHRLALPLLCGSVETGSRHVRRYDNGNWLEIIAPKVEVSDVMPGIDFSELIDLISRVPTSKGCILSTPLSPFFSAPLIAALRKAVPNVILLNPSAAALGALEASRLVQKGLPHYFDRLTPISLAVSKEMDPYFADLIGSETTLPANQEYISPPYRNLVWSRGKKEMDFFVLKGAAEVRYWRAVLEEAPTSDILVELRLRQTPGQSWAKLSVTSEDWEPLKVRPLFLDWEVLKPELRSPEEILQSLRAPPPTVPLRIVEEPSFEFWAGSDRQTSLSHALRNGGSSASPTQMATLISRSVRTAVKGESGEIIRVRYRTVGTDGVLPPQLSADERLLFDQLIGNFSNQLFSMAKRGLKLNDNDLLRCLTWVFTLCPVIIQEMIVEALEADFYKRPHPLLAPLRARTVLTQGAGRVISSSALIKRVLVVLADRQPNSDTMNALAMLLSRRELAPQALDQRLVAKLASLVALELDFLAAKNSFLTRFNCALSALAGLFRYRAVVPFALTIGHDPVAEKLDQKLENIETILLHRKSDLFVPDEKIKIVKSLRELLKGLGNQNILEDIDSMDTSEE